MKLLTAVALGAALALSACGSDSDKAEDETAADPTTVTAPPPEPTYVETEECRAAAARVLTDAEAARNAIGSDTIQRYEDAVIAGVRGIACGTDTYNALVTVAEAVDRYRSRWFSCEVSDQWMDYDGDGQTEETTSCGEANGAFVKLGSAIDDARALVDAKS